jgi:hypothetical protein
MQNRTMRRMAITAALVSLLAAAPAAEAKSSKRCAVKGATVIKSNRQAVLLERPVQYSDLEDGTEIWGCMRRKRRPLLVSSVSSDQYNSSSIDLLVLRGHFVASVYGQSVIDGTCYAGLRVVSLLSRRTKHEADVAPGAGSTCPHIDAAVLSPRGMVAWTQQYGQYSTQVRKIDNASDKVLDQGNVDDQSLALTQNADGTATVTWSRDGAQRTATLY